MKAKFAKKSFSLILAVLILLMSVPSVFAATPSKDELSDGYEYGTVLVSLNSGTASTIESLLEGFEIESIRLITPGSSTMNTYSVRFVEKTKEIVWEAIGVLQNSSYVQSVAPNYYRGIQPVENPNQSETEEPKATEDAEFEPGTVLVSLNAGTASTIETLLEDFEIESIRLITPGSSTMNTYSVRFVEKTKEVVWEAIDVLQNSSYVQSAAPNYYREIQPDDSTEPPTDTTEPSILKGDADGDGYVSITDATTIQRYLVGLYDLDDEQLLAADTDGDGYVSITDVTVIQRYLVGLVVNW